MDTQRVAVVGAGGVGGFFAAHLSGTHHAVTACVRRPFDRWLIESDESPFEGPATAVTDPSTLSGQPFDWVLVGVKAHQTMGAAEWFERTCGPDTVVVALQNGIEAIERLTPLVQGALVLDPVVYCGTELIAPGHILHDINGRLILPDVEAARDLEAMFEGTAALIQPRDGHRQAAWIKLSLNTVVNGITALAGKPMSVLGHPDVAPVAAALLREVLEVGVADGVELRLDRVEDTIERVAANPTGRTSMLQDVEAGRSTEHDAIHGAVMRAGRRLGVATPLTDMVHALLAARSPA